MWDEEKGSDYLVLFYHPLEIHIKDVLMCSGGIGLFCDGGRGEMTMKSAVVLQTKGWCYGHKDGVTDIRNGQVTQVSELRKC